MAIRCTKQELLAHYDEIVETARRDGEAVYITDAQGQDEMVLLDAAAYHHTQAQQMLKEFLSGKEGDFSAAGKYPSVDVLAELNGTDSDEP